MLSSRLQYTRTQRCAGAIERWANHKLNLLSFVYRVFGCPTEMREGVLLRSADPDPIPDLIDFATDAGTNLMKVTRCVAGPVVPGETRTERCGRWTVVFRSAPAREMLPVGPTDEATLAGFGRHTRRNVRNVRRSAHAAGFNFEISTGPALISAAQRARLAMATRPLGVRITLARRLEAQADSTGQPFRCVVRTSAGDVVSYACGYFGTASSAYLLYQLNHPAFDELSPSLLLRAYLLEWLSERGCAELFFVHGCTGVLYHACFPQPLEEILLLRRTVTSTLAARSIALAKGQSSLGRLVRPALDDAPPIALFPTGKTVG